MLSAPAPAMLSAAVLLCSSLSFAADDEAAEAAEAQKNAAALAAPIKAAMVTLQAAIKASEKEEQRRGPIQVNQ